LELAKNFTTTAPIKEELKKHGIQSGMIQTLAPILVDFRFGEFSSCVRIVEFVHVTDGDYVLILKRAVMDSGTAISTY
jgi:hypothetical protein